MKIPKKFIFSKSRFTFFLQNIYLNILLGGAQEKIKKASTICLYSFLLCFLQVEQTFWEKAV